MQNFYKEIDNILENSNLSKQEKIAYIKAAGDLYNKSIDDEYNKYVAKQYTGAALEILSAGIPGGAGVKAASKIAPKIIQKTLGRKFTNDIISGALNSSISSNIYGLGEGIANDKNPLTNSTQKTVEGLLVGGLISAPISKAVNNARVKDTLSTYAMRPYWGIAFRKSSGDPQKAIDTLMTNQKGFVPNAFYKDKIGNVDFVYGDTKSGLKHIQERRDSQGINGKEFIYNLPNTVKNSKPFTKKKHTDRKYLTDGRSEISIKDSYITKDNNIDRKWVPSAYMYHNKSEKNITKNLENTTHSPLTKARIEQSINNYILKNNPNRLVNPQTSFIGNTINSNSKNLIDDIDLDTVVTYRARQNEHSENEIYTPEQIGKMTPQEFAQNEAQIMEQFKKGQVKNQSPQIDYTTFKNPQSGKTRIFTREDIEKMTTNEYSKYEKEINAQLNSIGVPHKNELPKNTKTYGKEKSQNSNSTDSQNGRWVTINGNHVFIEND